MRFATLVGQAQAPAGVAAALLSLEAQVLALRRELRTVRQRIDRLERTNVRRLRVKAERHAEVSVGGATCTTNHADA